MAVVLRCSSGPGYALFTQEASGTEQSNGCFFTAFGKPRNFHLASLQIVNRAGGFALTEECLAGFQLNNGSTHPRTTPVLARNASGLKPGFLMASD
jgi:hypothetical protein